MQMRRKEKLNILMKIKKSISQSLNTNVTNFIRQTKWKI